MSVVVRAMTPADHAQVLALNEADVDRLSPLDAERLASIVAMSRHALVADDGGVVAAFVLTLGPGQAYDSANYAWFEQRYADHTYLDRVVVAPTHRRRGLAGRLYAVVEASGRVTLEVDVEPPNEPSLAFHRARGYEAIGRLRQPTGKVSAMHVREALGSRTGGM